jgi:hypothetical protein
MFVVAIGFCDFCFERGNHSLIPNCISLDFRLSLGLQDAVRDDHAAVGPVRQPDRLRVLEEIVQGARHLS